MWQMSSWSRAGYWRMYSGTLEERWRTVGEDRECIERMNVGDMPELERKNKVRSGNAKAF